jgi:hypothetical protein
MDTTRKSISLMDQIGPSIDHTKAILFAPFDLNRWLAIGFCAWLASFGEGGSSGGSRNQDSNEVTEVVNRAQDFLTANPMIAAAFFILGIILFVLVIWLSSRGRFMFYNCVLYNSDQVVQPWHYYKHLASSLFRFRLGLAAIAFAFGATMIGIVTGFGINLQNSSLSMVWPRLLPLLPLILIPLGLLICEVLTTDFVIPLMHKHTLTCTAAWSRLWSLVTRQPLDIFLYLLFKALIAVAIAVTLFFLGLMTCGCACCVAALPYVGTVLLLPVPTFKRSFSLFYLRQFGPDFDLFVSEPVPNEDQTEPTTDDYSI